MWILAQATQPAAAHWYAAEFLNNPLWGWAALLGTLVVTLAVARLVSFILTTHGGKLVEGGRFVALGMVLRCLAKPAGLVILAGGLYSAGAFMRLDYVLYVEGAGDAAKVRDLGWLWLAACRTFAALAIGWAVYRLVDVLEFFLLRWTSRTRTQLDDQLVPIIRKALRIFTVIVVVLFIAQNIFSMKIGPLLAGLGLGGLAFALAAQDPIKNFFGSVTIFADRPFQMGERVKIGEHVGTVEDVGFRSTRIRTRAGHLVTVPNAMVAGAPVENISRRPYIRRTLNVTVTYDTPPEKMNRAVDILREMLAAREDHFPPDKPGQVYFNEFNADSLNIVAYYWFTPPDWWEYLAFTHEFNMELLERFNAEGIEFAFPTQTLYVKGEGPITADVRLVDGERGRK